MKIIDFFKKLKEKFIPNENELERILILESQDSSYRNKLYEKLLNSELIFITEKPTNGNNDNPILRLENGDFQIFTSEKRLLDRKNNKEIYYLKNNGKELLKLLNKNTVIINPFSKHSFKIPPDTINKVIKRINLNKSGN